MHKLLNAILGWAFFGMVCYFTFVTFVQAADHPYVTAAQIDCKLKWEARNQQSEAYWTNYRLKLIATGERHKAERTFPSYYQLIRLFNESRQWVVYDTYDAKEKKKVAVAVLCAPITSITPNHVTDTVFGWGEIPDVKEDPAGNIAEGHIHMIALRVLTATSWNKF